MLDLLLPATDGGVLAQVIIVAVVAAGLLVIVRRNRDLRLLVVGITVLTFGLMAVRAVH